MTDWFTHVDDSPKPHLHPVVAPGGRVVTSARNDDHPWQRGLWFVVKFVGDGSGGEPVNFWEEFGDHGTQRRAAGDTIDWVLPTGDVVIREERSVTDVTGAVEGTVHALDWTSTLRAAVDVTLDRTPYQGWGGYGGLAFRGAPDWVDTSLRTADGVPRPSVVGEPSAWCDLAGPDAGVCLLDHPDNVRHPTPWYGNVANPLYGDGLWTNFVNAAFLFHEPLDVQAGTPLTMRYRVVVHDGGATAEEIDGWWRAFADG